MYKRLSSSKIQKSNFHNSGLEKLRKGGDRRSHTKTTALILVAIAAIVYLLSARIGARLRKNDLQRISETGNVTMQPVAQTTTNAIFEEMVILEKLEVSNVQTPQNPSQEMSNIQPSTTPGSDRAAETVVADQPNEILMEQNDRDTVKTETLSETVSETEAPSFANSQQEKLTKEIMEEWGFQSLNFHNLKDFKEIIGHQCPSLRHCSKKTDVSLFQRGGKWTQEENGEYMWNSHDCWMYQFSGREAWARDGNSNQQNLVIFVDGDMEPGMFSVASTMSELFHYIKFPFPKTYEESQQLEGKIKQIIEEHSFTPTVDVYLVLNWFVPGKAGPVSRMLFQFGASKLSVNSIRVLWTTKPFMNVESAQQIIQFNENVAGNIAQNTKSTTPWKVRGGLGPKAKSPSPADGRQMNRMLSKEEFLSQAKDSVLLDVRAESKNVQPHQEYFARNAYPFPILDILSGWVPNFHQNTKIVVFCGNGVTATKAARLLRQQGFSNVAPLALDHFADTSITENLGLPIRVNEKFSVVGIDTFAPSFAAPMELVVPGNSTLLARYTANTVLNDVFRNEIALAANLPPVEHICQSRSSCSSCFLSVGDIPSSRINFATINYLSRRNVPQKILLSKEHLIWDGDWVTFLEQNKQALLTVRKNYATARTRKFEKQELSTYLQDTNIVRKSGEGTFQETGDEPNSDSSLPIYAGNNKLNPSSMADYHFKYPKWIQRSSFEMPAMWLGPKGSLSSLHVDHSNKGNFAYQVLGAKKWILYPPKSFDLMYGKKVGIVLWSGIVDPTEYDHEMSKKLPAFQFAIPDSIEIDVHQGEMLFNPDKWWHVVYNIESSLMLNFWIKNKVGIRPGPSDSN